MSTSMELSIEKLGTEGVYEHKDELLAVYEDVYADELDDPFFSTPRYWELLEAYASRDGFSLVLATLEDILVGYALGYTLPAGSGWWRGLLTPADPHLTEENGTRTFAINELMVRAPWRRRGIAHALHDALLDARSEERASADVQAHLRLPPVAGLSGQHQRVPRRRPTPERAGVDGFVITTNIDLGIGVGHPLVTAQEIRTWTQLPVSVSGGFSTADDLLTMSQEWDIAIIGRSIADAVASADMTRQITSITAKFARISRDRQTAAN